MSAMPATHALVELLGEIALLLWGVHMVRTGVLRAFGGDLRRLLGRALRNRPMALLAGAGVTLALQSSTATALMATSFLASGAIGLVPALAVMLGANVGTALVTCALAFDITLVFPVLIFVGLVAFRIRTRARTRDLGRAAIGLGLILLALHLLVETIAPGGVTPEARGLVAAATREPLPVLVLAALLTWAMHSSIAAVLVIVSLAVTCSPPAPPWPWSGRVRAAAPTLEVWKMRACSCCVGWAKRFEAAGFATKVHEVDEVDAIRAEAGVPADLGGCHTSKIAGYVVEGHVPVAAVRRLLAEQPAILGLAVPGMPLGSPGMEIEGSRRSRTTWSRSLPTAPARRSWKFGRSRTRIEARLSTRRLFPS
jgi:hypothetical protein